MQCSGLKHHDYPPAALPLSALAISIVGLLIHTNTSTSSDALYQLAPNTTSHGAFLQYVQYVRIALLNFTSGMRTKLAKGEPVRGNT